MVKMVGLVEGFEAALRRCGPLPIAAAAAVAAGLLTWAAAGLLAALLGEAAPSWMVLAAAVPAAALPLAPLALAAARQGRRAADLERAAAERAAGLAALGHDLRAPLNAILGFSEVTMDQVFGPVGTPRYVEYAATIHRAGRDLSDMLEDVVDSARLDAGRLVLNPAPLDLVAVLDGVLDRLDSERRLPPGLEIDLPDACPPFAADAWAVERLLLRLLGAPPEDSRAGRVRLEVGIGPDGVAVAVSGTKPAVPCLVLAAALLERHGGALDRQKGRVVLRFPGA
jgi:signal transduction histidine kinase